MKRAVLSLIISVVAWSSLACTGNQDPVAPTDTSSTLAQAAGEVFSGSLGKLESSFFTFSVGAPGTVGITLVSLTTGTTGRPPQSAVMRLGFGVPTGAACEVTNTAMATPGLTAQFSPQSAVGTFCVEIRDIGNLTATTVFVVRIAHT